MPSAVSLNFLEGRLPDENEDTLDSGTVPQPTPSSGTEPMMTGTEPMMTGTEPMMTGTEPMMTGTEPMMT
ncbi:hypothetical protein, partial [Microcoleus sp. herbarium5]|uniref:hypothetical protein n=1 Tax=Microcoleus sp. herbarium5 TaxID=3055434 RepID=UPI002FCF4285